MGVRPGGGRGLAVSRPRAQPHAQHLPRALRRDRHHSQGGEDANGRDLAYDGNGSGNCWGPNGGVQSTFPADPAFFPACPFTGANAFSQDQQNTMVSWAGRNAVPNWIKHAHKPRPGYTPLEVYRP